MSITARPATVLVFLLALPGCVGGPANPAATQPATALDAKLAEPAYWYNQPTVVSVQSRDFDDLWRACREAAVAAGFSIDRLDARDGVITTRPLVSMQFFEFWRGDVATATDFAESTLHSVRRTVRFEIVKAGENGTADGAGSTYYEMRPKVLVERFSTVEHRITNVTQYRDIFGLTREESGRERERELDPTRAAVPATYWYPFARDNALERRLASHVQNGLKPQSAPTAPDLAGAASLPSPAGVQQRTNVNPAISGI